MTKKNVNIRLGFGNNLKTFAVEAESISIPECSEIMTNVVKLDNFWRVFEHTTGLVIGGAKTKKEAIEDAKNKIEMYGIVLTKKLIADAVKNDGIINQ